MEKLSSKEQYNTLWKKINICMANTDNKYGTFNKKTQILTQIVKAPATIQTFTTIEEAKSFFYTDSALAVFAECCTELQWTLVNGSTGLKYTMTFGTKGGNIDAENDWAETYHSRRNALNNNNQWAKHGYDTEEVNDHLF